MKKSIRHVLIAAGLLTASHGALALEGPAAVLGSMASAVPAERPKAASAQTLGSRGTVTPSATLFGGFEVTGTPVVYILVRGNSLQTLGVTNNFLDAPRVRLFGPNGQDILIDSFNRPGFNTCERPPAGTPPANDFTTPVVDFYQNVRRQPAHPRDACVALQLNVPGAWTFTVTPSIAGVTTSSGNSSPSSGEVLFEVTLNP